MRVLHAELAVTAGSPEQFPTAGLAEVAILGRSNVGKSSLLNKLVAMKKLARTSRDPGKTRLLHFYRVRRSGGTPEILLVDLPGYGYARVSQAERRQWRRLVEGYLEGREPLQAALLLQDLRRDVSDDEFDLLDWLDERGIPCLVAITKADKLPPMQRAKRVKDIVAQVGLPADRVVPTSATRGFGIDALWRAIDRQLQGSERQRSG